MLTWEASIDRVPGKMLIGKSVTSCRLHRSAREWLVGRSISYNFAKLGRISREDSPNLTLVGLLELGVVPDAGGEEDAKTADFISR